MNSHFIINMGCPYCIKTKEAILFTNLGLRPSEKINDIDIMKSRERGEFMSELFGSRDSRKWFVPIVVLDKPGIETIHRSVIPGRSGRTFIQGAWDVDHHYILISQYLKGGRYR